MKTLDKKVAYIVISSDTDSDYFVGDQAPVHDDKKILGWDGFSEGKEIFTNEIDTFAKQNHMGIPISWFMRCDDQIAMTHGSYTYLYEQHSGWWLNRLESGDEIQWHAHVYKRTDLGAWVQKTDVIDILTELREARNALESVHIFPRIIRIGESYHSTELMTELNKLQLEADSTALPGRKRIDAEKTIDWEITGNAPYHPSESDYRVPGEKPLKIWEIPMTTVRTQVSYDQQPLLRYVNLSFHPHAFLPDLDDHFARSNILVTMTHPFEFVRKFLKDSRGEHPLIAFDPTSIHENLELIIRCAEKNNLRPIFLTMGNLLNKLGLHD